MKPKDLQHCEPEELAELARAALVALAESGDPAAFALLLGLSESLGACIGLAARILAGENSWSAVADVAGTTRQAAWARWRAH